MITPEVTVVIPSHQRASVLVTALADLRRQSLDRFECIVVLQTPLGNDEIERFSLSLPRQLTIIFSSIPNASLARNIGLMAARAPIVLFLDDDVRLTNPDFLRNHLRHYGDPSVSGVYGQVLEVNQLPTDQPEPAEIETDWGWMKLPPNYSRPCRTRNGASNNLSVRRDWARDVGGMDAWFEKGARREETEFNLRYTKQFGPLVFDPEAGLTHLSAGGGSRTWGSVRRTVPMHHIVGRWYFLFRAIRDRTLEARGLALELKHLAIALFKNPQVGRDPLILLMNGGRALWGLAVALARVLRGPRRIATLDPSHYREIRTERGAA